MRLQVSSATRTFYDRQKLLRNYISISLSLIILLFIRKYNISGKVFFIIAEPANEFRGKSFREICLTQED